MNARRKRSSAPLRAALDPDFGDTRKPCPATRPAVLDINIVLGPEPVPEADTYILKSHDGSYCQTAKCGQVPGESHPASLSGLHYLNGILVGGEALPDEPEDGDMLTVRFLDVLPGKRYTLQRIHEQSDFDEDDVPDEVEDEGDDGSFEDGDEDDVALDTSDDQGTFGAGEGEGGRYVRLVFKDVPFEKLFR